RAESRSRSLVRTISRESAAGLACPVRPAENRRCDGAFPIHPDSAEDRSLRRPLSGIALRSSWQATSCRFRTPDPERLSTVRGARLAVAQYGRARVPLGRTLLTGVCERECPRQHFVQDDAHRVKITPRIDRPIHSPRLLRRHVRERTGDELRRHRWLTLTRHTRGDPKTGKPDLITAGIDQNVRWLDVFVNQLTLMQMSECCCETESDSEATPDLHRSVNKTIERFASTIVKDEHPLVVVARQRERLSCPVAV